MIPTVTFDRCTLPETDEVLDGTVGLRVKLIDRSVTITLEHLAVGTNEAHGSITAAVRGPLDALLLVVDADLTLGSEPATLVADGLHVDGSLEGVNVAGNGTVIVEELEVDAALDAVHWNLGECLPSSGTVDFATGPAAGVLSR